MMPFSPRNFIAFLVHNQALQFGEFVLKSGRVSPYFFNIGAICTGSALKILGQFYAHTLKQSGLSCDLLYGPAYKGIPLVSTTSIALHELYQASMPFCFNRKEQKQYGEKGMLVGASLEGDIVMLDDVITAGTTVQETLALFGNEECAHFSGVVVALDRQEKSATSQVSAVQEAAQKSSVPVQSIANLSDLLRYLQKEKTLSSFVSKIERYQSEYGV